MRALFTSVLALAALLGSGRLAFGQAAPPQYLSAARSDAWMDSVSHLPLPAQVAAVRARVLADTVLRHRQPAICFMPLSVAQREAYDRAQLPLRQAEAARPAGLLPLYMGDGYGLSTNNQVQTLAFVRELDSRAIRRVEFIKITAPATVLYGTSGANGVILLVTRNPKHR